MAMNVGARRGGQVSSINMTPMIDVLLVLLIIFMVVQGQLQRGLSLQVPPPNPSDLAPDPGDEALVLEVAPGGVYRLNQQPIASASLRRRLGQEFAERNRKVLFVKADERATYQEVITAVEASREAGVSVVGLVPRAAN
jgi:biopolymer transport protein TolR